MYELVYIVFGNHDDTHVLRRALQVMRLYM